MDSSQQMEDRLTTTERELLKVRGEKERIVRENTQLQHAKTSIEEEMRTTIQEYEDKLVAQQQKVAAMIEFKIRLILWNNRNHSDNRPKRMG